MMDPAFFKSPEFTLENDNYMKMKAQLSKLEIEWEALIEKL